MQDNCLQANVLYKAKTSKHKPKKNVTVIAGDSILKHLQGWKLSDINNHVVKGFAGATIEDMDDYLKPVIRKEPERIVLHIGTNDLRNLSPEQVAKGITNLCSQINEESPNTNIVISDNSELAVKAPEASKLLSATCSKNRWKFNHKAINRFCWNIRGLHFNQKGFSVIANNFSKFIHTQQDIVAWESANLTYSNLNRRGLAIPCLNVNSLLAHIHQLRIFLITHKVNIVAVNETKLDISIGSNEIQIPSYDVVRRDRSHNCRHGGGVYLCQGQLKFQTLRRYF